MILGTSKLWRLRVGKRARFITFFDLKYAAPVTLSPGTPRARGETHSTFEDYCIERWDIKKSHAYDLIKSSKVIGNLSAIAEEIPKFESQTRELSKAPPEEQAEVWKTAQAPYGRAMYR